MPVRRNRPRRLSNQEYPTSDKATVDILSGNSPHRMSGNSPHRMSLIMPAESNLNLLRRLRLRFTQQETGQILGFAERTVRRWETGESSPARIPAAAIYRLLEVVPPEGDFTFADLFAGIGGTRLGFERAGGRCVFTSEYDKFSCRTYAENFSNTADHTFAGDITEVQATDVPDHDVLLAGFPCQPFSIAGVSKKQSLGRAHGFLDETQGTMFFDIARILAEKRPTAFLLENVPNLLSHDKKRTFVKIWEVLRKLEYDIDVRVVSARRWVPQRRQRVLIVGFDRGRTGGQSAFDFGEELPEWRSGAHLATQEQQLPLFSTTGTKVMRDVLHPEDGSEDAEEPYTYGSDARVDSRYILSSHLWDYLQNYAEKHRSAGNGFGYGTVGPNDTARTLSARYYKDGAEILVNRDPGEVPRRLTPRECARLMGFPDTFKIPVSDTQAYKQFGNSIVVPMVEAVARAMRPEVLRYASPVTNRAAA